MVRVYHEAAVDVALKLTVFDCANCGIVFAVTTELEKRRREDGKDFYCPNGHLNCFNGSDKEKLRQAEEALAQANRSREWWAARAKEARDERDAAERSRSAVKGQVTKLRKRIAAGVCPYCTRHFTALEQHIATKHPGKALPAEAVE